MNGSLVPLSELVRVEESTLAPSRHRKNLRPVVYVTGDVAGAIESPVYALLEMGQRIDEIEVQDVIQFLRDVTGQSIYVNWKALR